MYISGISLGASIAEGDSVLSHALRRVKLGNDSGFIFENHSPVGNTRGKITHSTILSCVFVRCSCDSIEVQVVEVKLPRGSGIPLVGGNPNNSFLTTANIKKKHDEVDIIIASTFLCPLNEHGFDGGVRVGSIMLPDIYFHQAKMFQFPCRLGSKVLLLHHGRYHALHAALASDHGIVDVRHHCLLPAQQ